MKIKQAALIATVLVIITGFTLISPIFFRARDNDSGQRVMLIFNVSQSAGAQEWCLSLSSLLEKYNIGASVFFTGKIAEQYPRCVSEFSDRVDIGSATYSRVDLTGIPDYAIKLQEVQQGKAVVDAAGNLFSGVFKAPFGATDQDIYSLLSRSGILADFSYKNQYNVYQNGQFIKYNASVYEGRDYPPDFFSQLPRTDNPLIIVFDNTYPVSGIEDFLSGLKIDKIKFLNASELTGLTLTGRGSKNG